MRHFRHLPLVACMTLASCAAPVPANWARGGAPLELGAATWERPDAEPVQLTAAGDVFVDGELWYHVDAQGRLIDGDGDPAALLSSDGQVFSATNTYSGRVGVRNASPPWSGVAWVRIGEDGVVSWFDDDGVPHNEGRWTGCEGSRVRLCTLLTHWILLSQTRYNRTPYFGPPYYPYPYPYYPYYPYPMRPGVGFGIWY